MKLKKQPWRGLAPNEFVMASPSERWGMYRDENGRMTVVHLPTGQTARRDLLQRQARVLIEALEAIPTPALDLLPFGTQEIPADARFDAVQAFRTMDALLASGQIS